MCICVYEKQNLLQHTRNGMGRKLSEIQRLKDIPDLETEVHARVWGVAFLFHIFSLPAFGLPLFLSPLAGVQLWCFE
jgi:hypothetical protein